MSLARPSMPSIGELPKSVKVRSTCNACQQAKIRCSHEKPSCRRCQKHKIECVYSMSRRLGRPAKKRETRPDDQEGETIPHGDRERKTRKSTKKKRSRGSNASSGSSPRANKCVDKAEENTPETLGLLESVDEVRSPADLNLASNSWSQEIPTRVDWDRKISFEQPYGNSEIPGPFDCLSGYGCLLHPLDMYDEAEKTDTSANLTELDSSFMYASQESDPMAVGQLESPILEEIGAAPWLHGLPDSLEKQTSQGSWVNNKAVTADVLINAMDQCEQLLPSEPSLEAELYSTLDSPIVLDDHSDFGCDCYKHVMRELLRSGAKADVNGLSAIDSILASQKELLIQTEAILRCKLCSQSEAQANMLMIIVVTIDSLLTSLDATSLTTKASAQEGPCPTDRELRLRKQSSCGSNLKSHIDSCPLLVGGFLVPGDEKAWFIRQVFQTRLSTLLGTIRRIRLYMQHNMATALSRGRLMMIMETDRRLQLILMKVKMAV